MAVSSLENKGLDSFWDLIQRCVGVRQRLQDVLMLILTLSCRFRKKMEPHLNDVRSQQYKVGANSEFYN